MGTGLIRISAEHALALDRLEALDPEVILPAHGDPDVIAAGGYGVGIVEATRVYLTALLAGEGRPLDEIRKRPLRNRWILP